MFSFCRSCPVLRVLDWTGQRFGPHAAWSRAEWRSLDPHARTVSFAYKDYADGSRRKPLTLSGLEFLRRLRLHILPPGFTKIRHYGLLGNNRRHQRVPQARTALATSPLRFALASAPRPATPAPPPLACPHSQATDLRCIGRIDRSGKLNLFASPVLLQWAAPLFADSS